MEGVLFKDFRVFEDSDKNFVLHVLVEDGEVWFLAQDVAKSTGWDAKIGGSSPTRAINWKYKTTKKIQPEYEKGQAIPPTYEVLCLNQTGVFLFIEQIKKLMFRTQTNEFKTWFELTVVPAVQQEKGSK